jgi:hypothetical protein
MLMRLLWVAVGLGMAACTETSVAPFPVLDRDSNGTISRHEAMHDTQLAEAFPYVDADRDGELSAFEYLQAATRE